MNNDELKNEIIIYTGDDGRSGIEVRMQGETVWLTQAQIAKLFGVTTQNITIHLKNIFAERELDENRTCKKYLQVQKEGNREVNRRVKTYNLDVVIALGYRINSRIATNFRIWATERLKEYIVKGFTIDSDRLKKLGGGAPEAFLSRGTPLYLHSERLSTEGERRDSESAITRVNSQGSLRCSA